jgi:nucleotide-binding universal stress UspA family protein
MTEQTAPDTLLQRVIVPIASESDAQKTCQSLLPRIEDSHGEVIFLHVIEKGGGAPDKASVEQMETRAEVLFDKAEAAASARGIPAERRLVYGTDVVETILEAAQNESASSVAFTPRAGNRLVRWLSGDTALRLVTESSIPVIVFPESEEDSDS